MALRQLATGAGDGCSADDASGSGGDGAPGPSNPLGGLADALLGRPSKAHERAHELPGLGRPVPGLQRPGAALDAAAIAAAEGDLLAAVPGLSAGGGPRHPIPGMMKPGGGANFDAAFAEAFGAPRPQAAALPPPHLAQHLPATAVPLARLNPTLSAFVGAARSSTNGAPSAFSYRPPPGAQPPPPLAVPDACRLRDRAEALARQLGASGERAQAQVAGLLWSVGVDPSKLPPTQRSLPPRRATAAAAASAAPAAWESAWNEGLQHPAAAAEAAAAARAAVERQQRALGGGGGGGASWANEFSSMSPSSRVPPPPRHPAPVDSWASEFAAGRPPAEAWAGDFAAQRQQLQDASAASTTDAAAANADARAQSRALADALSSDPKMQSSKFLSFVSKMSRGEIVLDGNEAKTVDPSVAAGLGSAWADEHSSRAFDGAWRDATATTARQNPSTTTPTQRDWADQFASRVAPQGLAEEWASEFEARTRAGADGFGGGSGVAVGGVGGAEAQRRQAQDQGAPPSSLLVDDGELGLGPQYEFSRDSSQTRNPFDAEGDPLETARRLFRTGVLSEAALAAEAQVRRSLSSSASSSDVDQDLQRKELAAWRLLGAIHAENDDDRQAIAALRRAHALATARATSNGVIPDVPKNDEDADVLLSLGVSHTNELDRGRALAYLSSWLRRTHPEAAARHLPPVSTQQAASAPSQAVTLEAATAAFEEAAAASRSSAAAADAFAALGVLRSLGRDFEGAAEAFRRALDARPNDYSLWNKLGATLANAGSAADAAAAYRRALDAKPNYVRAWTNMGIASANLGDYLASSKYYARALALNPRASSVWGYLRTSLACAGRADLLEAADAEDAAAIERALPL